MQYSNVVIVSYLCDFGRDILFVILSSLVKLDALRENTQKHIQIECGREGLGLWLGLIHSRACYLRSSTCSTDRTSSAGISSNQPCITNTNKHRYFTALAHRLQFELKRREFVECLIKIHVITYIMKDGNLKFLPLNVHKCFTHSTCSLVSAHCCHSKMTSLIARQNVMKDWKCTIKTRLTNMMLNAYSIIINNIKTINGCLALHQHACECVCEYKTASGALSLSASHMV